MSPEIARLFTEGGPDEVVLPDCFQLNQEDLISVLTPAVTPRQVHTLSTRLCILRASQDLWEFTHCHL